MSHELPFGIVMLIVGILLLGWITFLLFRRGLHTELPVFTVYIVFHFVQAVIGLLLIPFANIYIKFYWSWGGNAIDGPLSIALIYELYSKAFQPYPGLRKLGIRVFAVFTAALTAIGIWIIFHEPNASPKVLNEVVILMNRSLGLIRITLLLALFSIHRMLGLSFRNYVFGVALGLTIETALYTTIDTLRIAIGWSWARPFFLLAPVAYDMGLAVWTYYFASAESRSTVSEVPYSPNLVRWNTALQEILTR